MYWALLLAAARVAARVFKSIAVMINHDVLASVIKVVGGSVTVMGYGALVVSWCEVRGWHSVEDAIFRELISRVRDFRHGSSRLFSASGSVDNR